MILSTIFILFQIGYSEILCAEQGHSPINLKQSSAHCDNQMTFEIVFVDEPTTVEMKKLQHSISTDAPISTVLASDMDGQIVGFTASTFEFRSPSEHKIDGVSYDMEMQIYHRRNEDYESKTSIAVVSVFFKIDKKSSQPFFDDYYFRVIKNQDSATLTINFAETLGLQIPQNPGFYTYMGSVTTPTLDVDCEDGVQWYILDSILPISKVQLQQFTQFFNQSNTTIISYQSPLVKLKGPFCNNYIAHDLALFLVYLCVIIFIYRAI